MSLPAAEPSVRRQFTAWLRTLLLVGIEHRPDPTQLLEKRASYRELHGWPT